MIFPSVQFDQLTYPMQAKSGFYSELRAQSTQQENRKILSVHFELP